MCFEDKQAKNLNLTQKKYFNEAKIFWLGEHSHMTSNFWGHF
jgi:hypothetical protein